MSRWLALLLFPVVPSIAARKLQGAWIAAVVPLVVAAAVAVYLVLHGAATSDSAWTGATLVRIFAGLAIGGAGASWIGARVVGRAASWTELAGPALAAAGWAPCVFIVFLGIGQMSGAGSAAGVYAGVGLLIWGIAAGFGIVGGEDDSEPGRLLVASCFGIGGAIIGLYVAYAVPPEPWAHAIRAPVSDAPIRAGSLLLVRTTQSAGPAVILLRKPNSREAVLARRSANGSLTPLGEIQLEAETLQDWNNAGYVFFQFGATGGESVGTGEQIVKPSQD